MVAHGIAVLFVAAAAPDPAGARVEIIRDAWGVPRIFGPSIEAVAYGLGYAQAEDRLEAILGNYLRAEGRFASLAGEGAVEADYRQRLLGHAEVSRRRFGDLEPRARRAIEAFVRGIRRYMADHPERVPSWATPPEPPQVLSLMRHAVWGWPAGQAMADLGRRARRDRAARPAASRGFFALARRPPGFGSNEWAVAPERTAEGCAIACIDPHVGLAGVLRWYEVHLHGGPLHAYGFAIPGTPMIALGHNDHLSWACTTGGPDTSDVYALKLDPKDPSRYLYEGTWRPLRRRTVKIEVRAGAGLRTVEREILRSHHGPIALIEGTTAYAVKLPYEEEVGLADQALAMALARDLDAFRAAMERAQFIPQNVMVADVDGNIFYLRTGRVPIRPEGLDVSRPLPGWLSASEWRGIHPQADLVHALNPPCGFFQNCNIGPDTMFPGSWLLPHRYPAYIYGDRAGRTNPRGERAKALLSACPRMTVDDARRIALDTGVHGFRGEIDRLRKALGGGPKGRIAEAWRMLASWDGRMEADSAAATLYYAWRRAMREGDRDPARAFRRAVGALVERFGRVAIPWGEIHRLRRGDRSWPAAGASEGRLGISTLRASGARPAEDGRLEVISGQSCTTVVALRGPGRISSWSALPYGESDDPASPHFADQAERLYARKRLKDTFYRREAELPDVERRVTLAYPGTSEPAPASGGAPAAPDPAWPVPMEDVAGLVGLVATPFKLGRPVLAPTGREGDFDARAVDCPNVFRFRDRWYMTYIGFDGRGYRTGLATSDDLIQWERVGMILDRGPEGAFDDAGAAGLSVLGLRGLHGGHDPIRYRGRYWMTYYGNDEPGYEAGRGSIGLAWSRDLRSWRRFEGNPILSPRDGAAWERGTLYKSFLLRGPDGLFHLFYNAKDAPGDPWKESTGLATSPDLRTWTRHPENPVLPHGPEGAWDGRFASDPIVFREGDLYVMFYYGFDGRHARDGLAASRDLVHWTKWPDPILDIGPPGSLDSRHAHKPSVVRHRGVFYHFYCSVRDRDGFRAITVAASRPTWGGRAR